jgi:hypothetical protein
MAVVINELEVAPQSAAPEPQGPKPQASAPASPEALAMMDKTLRVRRQRDHRLEAY